LNISGDVVLFSYVFGGYSHWGKAVGSFGVGEDGFGYSFGEDSGTVVGCHVFDTGCDSDIDFTGFDLVGDLLSANIRAKRGCEREGRKVSRGQKSVVIKSGREESAWTAIYGMASGGHREYLEGKGDEMGWVAKDSRGAANGQSLRRIGPDRRQVNEEE
jgi:hypothetical protein